MEEGGRKERGRGGERREWIMGRVEGRRIERRKEEEIRGRGRREAVREDVSL